MTSTARYGFVVRGSPFGDRRLIDWQAAFIGYCQCDDRADVTREAYLSAFTFGSEFRSHIDATGTTRGYGGPCCASWLWWDIDRDGDLDAATRDARRLAAALVERFAIDGDDLLAFFSGSKGYHVGLPLSLCGSPPPSEGFHLTARRFAERLAELAGLAIDAGVYDKVRLFRAPNSRHPKTSLHKRRLAFDELMHLRTDVFLRLAAVPEPFDVPSPPVQNPQAVADWQAAAGYVERAATARQERQAAGATRLNRLTLDFIRDGAATGDRHRLLFAAAANLAELGCPPLLAHELLTEAALDSGLPPSEVRRQIDCGLRHMGNQTV